MKDGAFVPLGASLVSAYRLTHGSASWGGAAGATVSVPPTRTGTGAGKIGVVATAVQPIVEAAGSVK